MTRNCLNVMRKVASGLQAAGKAPATGSVLGRMVGTARPGIADPMPGSIGYQINQQQNANKPSPMSYLSNSPIMTHFRRAGRAAYNTMTGGIPTATATPVPPKSQVMHKAPTGRELYEAQKQVDARRAKSGLPYVPNQHNGLWANFKYNPAVQSRFMRALTGTDEPYHRYR